MPSNSLLIPDPLQIDESILPYLQVIRGLAYKKPPKDLVSDPDQGKLQLLLPLKLRRKYFEVVGIYPVDWVYEKQQTAIGCVVEAQRTRRRKMKDGTVLPKFIRHVWLNTSAIDASPEQINDAVAYVREDLITTEQEIEQVALPLTSNFSRNIKWSEKQANNLASNSRVDGDMSSRELFRHPAKQSDATQKQPVAAPRGVTPPYPTFSARS